MSRQMADLVGSNGKSKFVVNSITILYLKNWVVGIKKKRRRIFMLMAEELQKQLRF